MNLPLSRTYAAALVSLLGSLGLVVSSDDLSTTISVIITVGGFLYQLVQRHQKGDVSVIGVKK